MTKFSKYVYMMDEGVHICHVCTYVELTSY